MGEYRMEFSLKEIIDLLIKRFLFIILCTLIGLSVFYGYTRYYIKPIYTASLKMYVSPSEMTASADLNELNYAQKVVATYISFLQTKTFYSKVYLDNNVTNDQISQTN
jgi:capsular polysaccharide biosynthesis protein